MNKLFTKLLCIRGFTPSFLNPKYDESLDPFILDGMKEAVFRIKKAVQNAEKVLIYGDYDVDGVTASTLIEQALVFAGIKSDHITIMLPDRFIDGYGMSSKLIKKAQAVAATLVITVDCGSRNHEIINELNELGIDIIITDHHETDNKVPEATAVINPHRKDAPTENLQNLAGVGVAFKLAQALAKENLIKFDQEKWLLDLVLIGTICDNMILTGENRTLGYYGLKVLAKTRRPGLKELMRLAGVKSLTSESIGFQIGPRLNAAGRLDTADIALNLLRSKSGPEAAALAVKLEDLNKKRKTEQISATREVEERGVGSDPVIIEIGNWHEGILGIVASRLVERYHRPAFVLTNTTDGFYKGSGRSFGEFNLAEALNYTRSSIISGGGHAAAAGVKIHEKNLYNFREQINEYYRNLHLTEQERFLRSNPDLEIADFSDLSLDFLDDLKSLEPFGAGNEEPIFRLKNIEIVDIRKMGTANQHLRLDVRDKNGKILKLVAFFAPESWLNFDYESKIEPLVKFTENNFNGVRSIEARIVDI